MRAPSTVASAALGAAVTCLFLSVATRWAERERLLARLRNGPMAWAGSGGGVGRGRLGGRGWPAALALAGLTGAGLGFHLAGPVGMLAGLLAAPLVVRSLRLRRVARSRGLMEDQFREGVVALAGAVRAGLSIRRAIEETAREAEPPFRQELESVLDELRLGRPLEDVLAMLARRLEVRDARLLATLLEVHRRTGGALPALLDELAAIIGQRIEARRQWRALTAQGRASGAVLAVLPIAFVGLLSGTSGDGLGAFYRTPQGSGLLLGGLICELIGFAWIRRIVRGSEP